MRSARGWDKLSQSFACLGSHPQPIATQDATIHAPASHSSVVDSGECGRVTMLIQIRRSQ